MSPRSDRVLTYLEERDALFVSPQGLGWSAIVIRGLPGAGKSTTSNRVADTLQEIGIIPFQINADFIRKGLNADLTFSENDRLKQAKSIGHIARLAALNRCFPVVDFVMPTYATYQAFKSAFQLPFLTVHLEPYHTSRKDIYSDTTSMFEDLSPLVNDLCRVLDEDRLAYLLEWCSKLVLKESDGSYGSV